ncbi:MAG: hypothetical protein KatS3mg031_2060 [Chitinophagales bacterium]|nr:MAG: hypothetical protein KatS3mg031_2060 [Chitinophagales bacterium]
MGMRHYILTGIFTMYVVNQVWAQPCAPGDTIGFRMTTLGGVVVNEGCVPNMIIQFTDISTCNGMPISQVNSPYNSHLWNFDHPKPPLTPNTLNIKNPVYGYFEPGTYVPCLTITADGINYTTVCDTLTVYAPPTIDITPSLTSGCNPLTVTFTNNITSPDGICRVRPDFGDGRILDLQGPQATTPFSHTFSLLPNQNCFTVTVLAESCRGCTASRTYQNLICIDRPPVASFTASTTQVCDTPFTVNFTSNVVSAPGNALDYKWYFGDGDSSSLRNPSHVYDSLGSYTVTLIVTDTDCNETTTVTRNQYINVEKLKADFYTTQPFACAGSPVQFFDASVSSGGSYTRTWNFGDGTPPSSAVNPVHVYTNPGCYNVTLTISNGTCTDAITIPRAVCINPLPSADFVGDTLTNCLAPFTVDFTALPGSPNIVSYAWNFGDGSPGSNLMHPSHTYTATGSFNVTLEVTSDSGCTRRIVKNNYVTLPPTVVCMQMTPNQGCAPLTVNFSDCSSSSPSNQIVWREWNFGDPSSPSNTSNLQSPTHTYNNPGTYPISLTITTALGCTGTYRDTIRLGSPLVPVFTANPIPACINEDVNFINLTDTSGFPPGITFTWEWNFGLGGAANSFGPHVRQFTDTGTFTITLQAGYNGCRSDTSLDIVILGPKADFYFIQDCANPGVVIFRDSSQGGDQYLWTTSGVPATSTAQNVTVTYPTSGTYQVTLEVSSTITGCTDQRERSVEVSVTNAMFVPSKYLMCVGNDSICFQNQSTGQIRAGGYLWNFGDGTTSTAQNACHAYSAAGNYTVTLSVTDVNNCTSTYSEVVSASQVTADFDSPNRFGCIPPTGNSNTVTFNDLSTVSVNSAFASWEWNFNDPPSPPLTYSAPQLPSVQHTFNNAGLYTVSLRVTNTDGCTDTETKTNYVDMKRPQACFTTDYNLYCVDQCVPFRNCTPGGGMVLYWDFGDGSPVVTGGNVCHPYDSGVYTVKMWAVQQGCVDTAAPRTLTIQDPELCFEASDTTSVCPPHLACFNVTCGFSNLDIDSVFWDFGDRSGSFLEDPCHIYNRAGLFEVTLYATFENGCLDSVRRSAYISVGGAVGDIVAEPDSGCAPQNVLLNAQSPDAVSRFWIWNDGNPNNFGALGADTISHVYERPGIYTPAVVLTDSQTPPCSYVLYIDEPVYVDTVFPGFSFPSDSVCMDDPIPFTDTSYGYIDSTIVAWLWDFGDGTTDTVQNPVHSFRQAGQHTITLTATNGFGCSSSVSHTLYVRDKPSAFFTVSDQTGCDSLLVSFTDGSTPGSQAALATWYWDFDGRDSTSGDTYNGSAPLPYFYPDTGAYQPYLVVTDVAGCDDTFSVAVNVYPSPNGLLSPDTVVICLRDSIQLLADSGYASYDWSPGLGLSDSTLYNPYASPPDTLTYYVIITESHGCTRQDSVTVQVIPLPPLSISPYPDTIICAGDTIQLAATGGTSYVWVPPHVVSNPVIATPLAFPDSTVTIRVVASGVGGCQQRDSVRVIVSNLQARMAHERNCLGDSTNFVDLSYGTDVPIVSWQWDFGDGTSGTGEFAGHTYGSPGQYDVMLVITDSIGCTDTTRSVVIIDSPAVAVALRDTVICLGQSVQLFSSGGTTVYWTPNQFIDSMFSFNPIVNPPVTTTYWAHLTNGVCPYDSVAVEVVVMPPPIVETIEDRTILRGETIELTTYSNRYDSIVWRPADSLSCADCLSPLAGPDVNTTYTITVYDRWRCSNSDQVTISVDVECNEDLIFVANAFTPNDDGVNDVAYVHLRGMEKLNYYRVFDRWGKLVFETTDVNVGWDGTDLDGQQLNTGVFVYVVEAVCFYKKVLQKTGNITLLK